MRNRIGNHVARVEVALLPAFPGIGAVKRAWSSGAGFLGATLHVVDETVDMGPVIAQTSDAIPHGADFAWCERLSFIQKTFLTLVFFELMMARRSTSTTQVPVFTLADPTDRERAQPLLTNDVLATGFQAFRMKIENEMAAGTFGVTAMAREHEEALRK